MSERPVPLPNLSDSLWSGVAKCLAKYSGDRFSSFGEVSAWLASEIGTNSDQLQPPAPQQERVPHHEARDKAYTAANLRLYPEALRWCRMAVDEDPNDFEAWSLRGRILGALGRWREAIEAHERATSLNSESDEVWQ
jgi:tetratricopeptide (TPR) repeat protein